MLKRALRYIRQKPKAVRNQYALVLSSVFTAMVVFVWIISGGSSLDEASSSLKASEGNTPFSNLIKQAKDQFASSKVALDQAASSTASSTEANATAGEMILSAETIEGIDQSNWSTSTAVSSATTSSNFGFSTAGEASSTPKAQYIEVQIATTTSASNTPKTSPQ